MSTPGAGKVFRRKANGKTLPRWYLWWVDSNGRKRSRRGYVDKQATEAALHKVQVRIAREVEGLRVPSQDDLTVPLSKHLADFLAHIGAGSVTPKYLKKVRSRIEKSLAAMQVTMFRDLSAEKAELFLADMRRHGTSKKTSNDYCAALKQFTLWLSKTKGWSDPLARLNRVKGQDDIRVKRVALTREQLSRLFDAAPERSATDCLRVRRAKTLESYKRRGIERTMIYRVGALAGLRLNEIKTLTWDCLDLDKTPPTCTIHGKYAKSRRTDTVPLNSALAASLREWRDLRRQELGRSPKPSELVFHVPRHILDYFKKDCEFAGIPLTYDNGAVLDLYGGTRHTFCTLLANVGVPAQKQRLLMRHTDLRTTLQYTHLQVIDLVDSVELLPETGSGDRPNCAEYMRNGTRFSEQIVAHADNIEVSADQRQSQTVRSRKPLNLQGLATLRKQMQRFANPPREITSKELEGGLEPPTPSLRVRSSTY